MGKPIVLTKEQEDKIPEYRKIWEDIGLDTEIYPDDEMIKAIKDLYAIMKFEEPTVTIVDSPKACLLLAMEKYPNKSKSEIISSFMYGQQDGHWIAFYHFFRDEVKMEKDEFMEIFEPVVRKCHWYLALENEVILSRKPLVMNVAKGNVLHCETGPVIEYRDGWKKYCLNNVGVPEWLVMSKDCDLDPKQFFTLKNVEERREFIRKFGVERLKSHGKLLDKKAFRDCVEMIPTRDYVHTLNNGETKYLAEGVYELYDMGKLFPSKRNAPYLFMLNPSLGTFCAEGVPQGTKTVEEALRFRNKTSEKPKLLT